MVGAGIYSLIAGNGNFEPPEDDLSDGPGDGGEAYELPPEKQNAGADSEMEYGMNMVVSDAISLDRAVKDTRLKECKRWNYPTDLPSASVIIVFHNEGLSVLMRTVHSVSYIEAPVIRFLITAFRSSTVRHRNSCTRSY